MAGYKVGYFVGSLSTKSINRLLAKALVQVALASSTLIDAEAFAEDAIPRGTCS